MLCVGLSILQATIHFVYILLPTLVVNFVIILFIDDEAEVQWD